MTEIIHNCLAGKDGTIIFSPWEDAEVNNHMAYYIEKIRYLCSIMSTSRIYHSYHLDISHIESNRICYVILTERLKETEKEKEGKNPILA